MIVTGYLTLEDRDNIDEIEIEVHLNVQGRMLGLAVEIIYDSIMNWAILWAEHSYKKKENKFVIGIRQFISAAPRVLPCR